MPNRLEREFAADSQEFQKSIIWTAKGTNNDYPNINFVVQDGMLSLHSYNGVHGTQSRLPVEQKFNDDLRFSVPSSMILNVIQSFKAGPINFKHSGKLLISAPRVRVNLPTTNPREIPQLPDTPRILGSADRGAFNKMATYMSRVAGDDPMLTQLTIGVLDFLPKEGIIRLSSTDSYRIIMRDVEYEPSPGENEDTQVVLDSRSLRDMISSQKDEDNLVFSVDSDMKNFSSTGRSTRGTIVTSATEPKKLAPFRNLVFENQILMDRKELQEAFKYSKPMISRAGGIINFVLEDQAIFIRSYEDGRPAEGLYPNTEVEIELLGTNFENTETVSIFTKLEFFQSMVDMADSELVRLDFNTPSKPLKLVSMEDEETENTSYLSIFMPVKV